MREKEKEPLSLVEDEEPKKTKSDEADEREPMPSWRTWLAGAALMLGLVGAILYAIGMMGEPPTPADSQSEPAGGFSAQSLTPHSLDGGGSQPATEADLHLTDWSTLLMKLGFSFVVGFSIAYAVSGFLKLSLFVAGLAFLLLFGLQYAGLIEINWHNMEGHYDAFIAWLQPRIGSFREFITSNLPASGMAAAGLVVGFKR